MIDSLRLFLLPILFGIFILAQAIFMHRTGPKSPLTKFCRRMVVLQIALYILGFLVTCSDPYYYDMSAKEFIPWNERWLWAIIDASFIELYVLPFMLLILGALYIKETKQLKTRDTL